MESPSCCWIEVAWLKDLVKEKRKTCVKKELVPKKGNVFETTLKQTSVKHQGLFSEASFNTFEIVTSHNFDVLTGKGRLLEGSNLKIEDKQVL